MNPNNEIFKLGNVVKESKKRFDEFPDFVPVVYGVSREGLTQETKYQSNNLERYKVIAPGCFAYNPMRLNIGSIGFCSYEFTPGLVSPDYVVFECDRDKILPDFLNYYIKTESWCRWTENAGVGSVRVRIYFKELAEMPIILPSLTYQKKAVEILNTLDAKIKLNNEISATLEAMARSIFKDWFIDYGPVRARSEARQPFVMDEKTAALFPNSFEESELGMIPRGWRVGSLSNVCDISRNTFKSSDKEIYNYLGLEHLPQGSFAIASCGSSADVVSNKFKFKKGDILFGKLRPYFKKVVPAPFDGVCSTDILVLKGKQQAFNSYALFITSSDSFIQFNTQASQGTKMPRTSWEIMNAYLLTIPSEDILIAFNRVVEPLINQITETHFENQYLRKLRDLILPKLVAGELSI